MREPLASLRLTRFARRLPTIGDDLGSRLCAGIFALIDSASFPWNIQVTRSFSRASALPSFLLPHSATRCQLSLLARDVVSWPTGRRLLVVVLLWQRWWRSATAATATAASSSTGPRMALPEMRPIHIVHPQRSGGPQPRLQRPLHLGVQVLPRRV